MKRNILAFIYSCFLLIFILNQNSSAQKLRPAQNPAYGPDSASRIDCAANLSTMSEFVKIKVYDYAYDAWLFCFTNCPASHKNIYIMGEKIIENRIEKAEDEVTKQNMIDTLLLLYDRRIEHFGQEGLVLGKKGMDIIKYRPDRIEDAYTNLKKSLELREDKVDDAAAVYFMQSSNAQFKKNMIGADQLIADYVLVMDNLEKKLKSGHRPEKTGMAIETVEKTFAESGAADCTALIDIFTPKFDAAPQDLDLLKKITGLLVKTKCEDSELFANASENLYSLEPSAAAAANLARLFTIKEEYNRASEYYKKAIDQETDNILKAEYYYNLGVITFLKLKQNQQARSYALEAIQLKPGYGAAYILIGNVYAGSGTECGSNPFEKAAVFLVAVDKYVKAKQVDASVTEEANRMIERYSQYFPNNEDAFFHGFKDGDSYTVGCWINEKTTVRTTKTK